jgi:hypothetical protein
MYNNKQHKIAQKDFQEGISNVKEYLENVGKNTSAIFGQLSSTAKEEIPQIIEDIKQGKSEKYLPKLEELRAKDVWKSFSDLVALFAPFVGGEVAARLLLASVGITATGGGMALLPAFVAGGAAMLASEGAMSIIENIKGDLAIYKDYLYDFHKDLDALSQLYPKNNDLKMMIFLMRKFGDKGLKIIEEAKENVEPKVSTNKNKRYKLAIVGEANWGSYGHQGLSGAAMGAAMSAGNPIGALIGGLGMGLADASKDIFHAFQSKEYKAAAYTHELAEKTRTLVNQLVKYDKLFAMQLSKYVDQLDIYVRKRIYKEEGLEDPKELINLLNAYKKRKSSEGKKIV